MDKKIIRQKLINGLMENEASQVKINCGVLIKCTTTGNVLLLLRNDPNPTWALVSGGINAGEDVLEGLKREIYEEMFVNPNLIQFKFIRTEKFPEKNAEFHYYEGFIDNEFKPILDEENLNFVWCDLNHPPKPLFNGLLEKIKNILK